MAIHADRDPKTAECWHCNLKYADVYKNDNKQLVGKCGSCGDVHVIVSAPKVKVKQEKDNGQK